MFMSHNYNESIIIIRSVTVKLPTDILACTVSNLLGEVQFHDYKTHNKGSIDVTTHLIEPIRQVVKGPYYLRPIGCNYLPW